MGTKVNSNYEDLISFVRASSSGRATALRPVSYGTELVTNGDFATDSDWTKGTGWSISGGQATHVAGTGSNLQQSVAYGSSGTIYALSVDVVSISGGSGSIQARTGGATTAKTIDGDTSGTTVTLIYVHDGLNTDVAITAGSGTSLTVDNISVKEVLFDQPDGTLTLFEHPENVPRVEYDADGNRLGLLVEEQRTNLITYSEDLESSYWTKQSSVDSVDDGNIAGPDGTLSGTKVTTNAVAYVTRDTGIYSTQNSTVTFSAFLKAGSITTVGLHYAQSLGDGLNDNCDFDLSNGTVSSEGSASTAKIKYVGNGWYRCSNTYTTNGSGTGLGVRFVVQGAGTYYVYGAQLEEGSFPTSYIKSNSGSTTTRSADVASIPVADFGSNDSSYSMLLEAISSAPDNAAGTGNNINNITQLKSATNNYSSLGIGSTSVRTNRPSLTSRNNAATIVSAGDVASLDNTLMRGCLLSFALHLT